MTANSVKSFGSMHDFLTTPMGQVMKYAAAVELPAQVPALEGAAEVRVGRSMAQALSQEVPHQARAFESWSDFMKSATFGQVKGLTNNDLYVVETTLPPPRTLGQALATETASEKALHGSPVHRPNRLR